MNYILKRAGSAILISHLAIAGFSQRPVLNSPDLSATIGKWTGSLTYRDYSSNNPISIPATLSITAKETVCFVWEYDYPKEPGHGSKTEYCIRDDGQYFNERKLVQKKQENGELEFVFEENGKDGNDNKPAIFQHIIKVSSGNLIITKLVRQEGESVFIQRHQYVFNK